MNLQRDWMTEQHVETSQIRLIEVTELMSVLLHKRRCLETVEAEQEELLVEEAEVVREKLAALVKKLKLKDWVDSLDSVHHARDRPSLDRQHGPSQLNDMSLCLRDTIKDTRLCPTYVLCLSLT